MIHLKKKSVIRLRFLHLALAFAEVVYLLEPQGKVLLYAMQCGTVALVDVDAVLLAVVVGEGGGECVAVALVVYLNVDVVWVWDCSHGLIIL